LQKSKNLKGVTELTTVLQHTATKKGGYYSRMWAIPNAKGAPQHAIYVDRAGRVHVFENISVGDWEHAGWVLDPHQETIEFPRGLSNTSEEFTASPAASSDGIIGIVKDKFKSEKPVLAPRDARPGERIDWHLQQHFYEDQNAAVSFSGTLAEATKAARDTVIELGDDRQEFGVLVAVAGPDAKDGKVRMEIRSGAGGFISWNPDSAQNSMLFDPTVNGAYELFHNHPGENVGSGGPVSTGDIIFLNGYRNCVAIHATNQNGSVFTARIPGRTAEKLAAGDPHAMAHPSGNLHRSMDEALHRTIAAYEISRSDKPGPYNNDQIFLISHSVNLGLMDAGFIDYQYKLSERQQKVLTDTPKELFDKMRSEAAKGAKAFMPWAGATPP
jgi:hypothetical protein